MPPDLIRGHALGLDPRVVRLSQGKRVKTKYRALVLIPLEPIRLSASHVSLFDLYQMFRWAPMANRRGRSSASNLGCAVVSVTSETLAAG
jgi:hypothetical protein